jgi:pimeloyl-ACP methyl ester carboxylesterase
MATDDEAKRIQLEDGRGLAYEEYGAPDGKPVFYFHGHPGSRRDWPIFDGSDSAAALNARVIAIDRPGYGLSDFQRRRQILDWPDDVTAVADALKVDRFAVLGISGGGPYAAACAFKIPERVTKTAIICGMGPAEATGAKTGIAWEFAAGRSSLMRTVVLTLMSYGLRKKPETFISKMIDGLNGEDKALISDSPELARKMIDLGFAEAFRHGIAGIHHDAGLYASPWGFRLQDIAAEIHLWHGEEDENVPVSVGRYVAEALPNCHAKFIENEGHFSVPYKYTRESLSVLIA